MTYTMFNTASKLLILAGGSYLGQCSVLLLPLVKLLLESDDLGLRLSPLDFLVLE